MLITSTCGMTLNRCQTPGGKKEKNQWVVLGDNQNYLTIKSIAKKYNYPVVKEFKKTIDERELNPLVRRYIETMQMKKTALIP